VELGEEITVRLDPGDALVLYTDGVIEAHRGSAPIGEDGLETLLLESAGLGAEAIASRIERAVLAHVHGARDDIAVLVLRAEDAVRAA
jgi:serine phosphatase RsbU (regulator of sigma subunit)